MTNTAFITRADQMQTGLYKNLTDDTGVKGGPGQLHGFYVNSTSSGVIQVYDGLSTAGTAIGGQITPAIGWHNYPFAFANGLYVEKVSGTIDITVSYV